MKILLSVIMALSGALSVSASATAQDQSVRRAQELQIIRRPIQRDVRSIVSIAPAGNDAEPEYSTYRVNLPAGHVNSVIYDCLMASSNFETGDLDCREAVVARPQCPDQIRVVWDDGGAATCTMSCSISGAEGSETCSCSFEDADCVPLN